MSQQQTVLRVLTNIPGSISGTTEYEFLDLTTDIPIKLNKSFAELQDIAKKNSDYSIGLSLPGSKKNNRFFENFFNVDTQSLYFNATKRVPADVLLGDEPLFKGYLKLNKVSVKNSAVEYDVTLFSTVADLFGAIGNNLLKDLNYNDEEYFFNHVFNLSNVTESFDNTNFAINGEHPLPYIYPVVHNGYNYSGNSVTFSGTPVEDQTRLYTSTQPISAYATQAAAWAAGVEQYHINSPGQGLIDNQLKPALNVYSLIKLMFKSYGYTIKSDFFNTPWMKTLYMYGYYSSQLTKFGYTIYTIQTLPVEGVELVMFEQDGSFNAVMCKLGTATPCYCDEDVYFSSFFDDYYGLYQYDGYVPYGTSGITVNIGLTYQFSTSSQVPISLGPLKYMPKNVGDSVAFTDGQFVDFSLVIDQNIKQIDLLSSIAKKFNLVFIPDPEIPNQLIIEPYDFYVGTGDIKDWTPKLSYDKGWSVEPALNYIESTIILTDQEDGDEGNRIFKNQNNRIYGRMNYYGPTSFKSQEKVIDTIFSPELIRKWDRDTIDNIGLPLGINYVASSVEDEQSTDNPILWQYKGIKTKPKLMYWLGAFNPFLDQVAEHNDASKPFNTYSVYVSDSTASYYTQSSTMPVISHTMPMGLADKYKINNDSQCLLFNSELPENVNIGVDIYNTYTENSMYSRFYNTRISNIYSPNTRFLKGYFDLKYSDVKNLSANDIIKIQAQYFIINKISEFNLIQRELTEVELIQFNNSPQEYPTRYFQYKYCDTPGTIYKFKTDFTNPNLLNTNFGWSIYYDHQVGSILSFQTTGFTSTFLDIQGGVPKYVPYSMYEVTENTYNTTGTDWSNDTLHNYIYSIENAPFGTAMPTYWTNSGVTTNGVNVFTDCADFSAAATVYGILTGSSTYHA